jgi:acyl carrier protein
MKGTEVFDKITMVLRDVFDDDHVVATADLTANKVDGWDSLGNVRLFLALEKAFSVRFSATEIGSLKNVGQLADLIESKTQRIVSRG